MVQLAVQCMSVQFVKIISIECDLVWEEGQVHRLRLLFSNVGIYFHRVNPQHGEVYVMMLIGLSLSL